MVDEQKVLGKDLHRETVKIRPSKPLEHKIRGKGRSWSNEQVPTHRGETW